MQKKWGIAVIAALMAGAAHAQGVTQGMERGADQGNSVGGPIGGVVGGAVGGVVGGIDGLLGIDDAPRFREHIMREHRSSYRYDEGLRAGVILPATGIGYYPVPPEYHVSPRYRYTIINDHAVLVDPETRRVVQVLD